MLVPTAVGAGTLSICWIAIKNEAGLIVFAILYGAFSGLILTLVVTCVPALATNMKTLGTNIGMWLMFISFGVLIGTPISGAILRQSGQFSGFQAWAGCVVLLGPFFFAASRVSKVGFGMAKI